ncbi:MAG TPA: MBL fold metallo-hydrolase [Vicinamibacterales bacterium]|jgi:glyoxylase-like metal-dependent hydrolase (beta-lactamase superfamily II)|nr:MBL fold metallo-hydrolase [Vicinamibacterales bacterium]
MFKRFVACAISATFLPAVIIAQQPVVRTADPIKRGMQLSDFPRTVKVSDNVYTYEDFHAGPEKFTTTNMFVVTDAGVLVADGQGSVAETKGLVDAIRKVTTQPITTVVIASDHGDHTAGNAAFPAGVHYLIHPTSKAILDRAAEAAAKAGRESGWKAPADAEIVADRKSFTMGREQIQILFLGRSHTGGDLAVYLPGQKILFLSEIYLNRVFPAMRSAYPSEWLKALDKAEAMQANIYIAGHGFTETGAVSREEIRAYHKAMEAVIAEATRLYKAGVPVDQAVKQANWGEYASWTLSSSQGPIAIRKVYEELSGQLK